MIGEQDNHNYTMTNKGISWGSDASIYKKTDYVLGQVEPPPNWILRYPNGYTEQNPIPDLSTYEEFQVWMRTAGLPTFSKLALRNDNDIMRAGTYRVDIYDCECLSADVLLLLTCDSLPGQRLRWHQNHAAFDSNCDGW